MASKHSPTNRDAEPPRIDDLKLINGIGPAVEQVLHSNGIKTFSKLAGHSPADISGLLMQRGLSGMTSDRIKREDWIGQARKLAKESTSSETQQVVEATVDTEQAAGLAAPVEEPEPDLLEQALPATPLEEPQQGTAPSPTGYHPATFTVELLLDEDNKVYSTYVMHVQSNREQTWTGWEKTQLVDFLDQSIVVKVTPEEPVLANAEEPEYAPAVVVESTPLTTYPVLIGTLHLRDLMIIGAESAGPRRILSRDQPFDVHLTLDLTEMTVPGNTPLNYKASIYGKSLGSRSGQVVGEVEGTIKPADTVTINVEGTPLAEGTYKLAATVIVALPGTKLTVKPGTTAVIGDMLEVH